MSFLNKFRHKKKTNNSHRSSFSLKRWLNGSVHGGDDAVDDGYDGEEAERRAEEKEDKDPVANYMRIEMMGLKRSLHFPASYLTTGNELRMYAPMKTSSREINKNGWIVLVGMIAGLIIPLFIPQLGAMGTRFLSGVILACAFWFFNYMTVKSHYARYSFKNQLRFNTFLTVLDLSELKRGYSINALLAKTADRFEDVDKTLSNSVSTLNSRIQDKPTSPAPYLVFAREFSTTQRARLFMMAVYRMAQGNYDDSQIKSLKHSSADELSYQSEKLSDKKNGKFTKLQLMEFVGFILYLVVYILFFIGLHVFQIMKGSM